jgi:hypothetical protein
MAEIKAATQKEMQESSHSMALFGDAFGVTIPRHIRTFINTLPGVSAAMSTAFNAVAILVVIDVLVKAGEKVKQLAEAYSESGKKAGEMSNAFSKVLTPIQNANNSLEVQKDQIQKSIDKLEHKPHNAIKDAIDEAIESADTLLEKVRATSEKISETLRKQSVSRIKGFITGQDSNAGIATGYDNFSNRFERVIEDYKGKLSNAKLGGATQAQLDDIRKEARTALTKVSEDYRTEYQSGDASHIGYTPTNAAVREQKKYNPNATSPGYDYSATIKQLTTVDQARQGQLQHALNQFDLSDLKARQGKDEAGKGDASAQMKHWEDQLQDAIHQAWTKGNIFSVSETADFWGSKLAQARPENRRAVEAKADSANKELTSHTNMVMEEQREADAKKAAEAIKKEDEAAVKAGEAYNKTQVAIGKYNEELLKGVKYGEELASKTINWQEHTGQISQADAAQRLLNVHTEAYKAEMASLADEVQRLTEWYLSGNLTDSEFQAKLGANTLAQQKVKGDYGLQHGEDVHNTQLQSASQGFHDFFSDFVADADNSAKQVHQLLSTLTTGLNANIVKAIDGEKTNFGQVFKQMGDQMMESSLKKMESAGMKALGLDKLFGGGKPDGSAEKPFHVVQGGVTGSGGAAGGLLGGLFSKWFGGGGIGNGQAAAGIGTTPVSELPNLGLMFAGFANGGDPDPYKTSIVGENGPELFTPRGVAGTITSNKNLKGLAGGSSVVQHFNIDATGSNPADVDMRVRQGAAAAYSQAMQDSPRAQQERARRRPSSFRG